MLSDRQGLFLLLAIMSEIDAPPLPKAMAEPWLCRVTDVDFLLYNGWVELPLPIVLMLDKDLRRACMFSVRLDALRKNKHNLYSY